MRANILVISIHILAVAFLYYYFGFILTLLVGIGFDHFAFNLKVALKFGYGEIPEKAKSVKVELVKEKVNYISNPDSINNLKNYFIIYNILVNHGKTCLEQVFKDRWLRESGGESQWKSSPGFGVFLADRFEYYKNLSPEERLLIDSGLLEEKWDVDLLSTILLKFQYKNINQDFILSQNKHIEKIKSIYLKIIEIKNSEEFKLNDKSQYNDFHLKIKNSIHSLVGNNLKGAKDLSTANIGEEIISLEWLSRFSEYSNSFVESMKRKDYCCSTHISRIVMDEKDIPITYKAQIYSNLSYVLLEEYSNETKFPNISTLYEAKENAINSILLEVDNPVAYYRLGLVLKKLGKHECALSLFSVAKYFKKGKKENKIESQFNLMVKMSQNESIQTLVQRSNFKDPKKKRDFIQEAKNFIKNTKFNILDSENDNIPNSFVNFIIFRIIDEYVTNEMNKYKRMEGTGKVMFNIVPKGGFRVFLRTAHFNFPLSLFFLSECYSTGIPDTLNPNHMVSLSLMYQSSLNNTGYKKSDEIMCDLALAQRFLYGGGLDIDIEQSIFYFERAVAEKHAEAMFKYGALLYNGYYDFIPKDKERGLDLIKKSAIQFDKAQIYLKEINEDENKDRIDEVSKNTNIEIPNSLYDFDPVKKWSIYMYIHSEKVDKLMLKWFFLEENSIDYFDHVARLYQQSKESEMATKLINAIALFQRFIQFLETADKTKDSDIEESSQLLYQLYLSPEYYIINFKPYHLKKLIQIINNYNFSKYKQNIVAQLNMVFTKDTFNSNRDAVDPKMLYIETVEKKLKEDPGDLDLHFMVGKLYCFYGELDYGFDHFKIILDSKKKFPNESLYFYLAEIYHSYYIDGDGAESSAIYSIKLYQTYIEYSTVDGLRVDYSHFCISYLFLMLGDNKNSKLWYEKGCLYQTKQLPLFKDKIKPFKKLEYLKNKFG
ncbi:hypothetical protein DICPUDRAFT_159355 [Dictyostelium purpureum]|uniref:Uncharacterized protein n=1 Tax=Dictyostelium purpureum TaxID=5786 RepID=F1A3X0_DICPU|nr:uncharacterized protein DICPUDRAFT_159355 [Dictyostelium purpureum]EGC29109.1 hypothetical protein DICPUDRAFT_159355 [Dictyostelium purpureum]|eukprot:XP_003294364.1 hypothetical protein DICPUDRAFT_159355 [Dictyostelium purpureum]